MIQKIKKRIIDYVRSNYTLLSINKFIKGKTYLNARCHLNAVQEFYDNGSNVCLCVCVGNDEVFVHFINQDAKGNYIDNTLGWYGQEVFDYFLIRKVNENEYHKIWQLLVETKRMLININSNWLERKLKLIKENEI